MGEHSNSPVVCHFCSVYEFCPGLTFFLIGANRFIRSASFAGGAVMLQNRQNQVASVQIAARRNLDNVALVAGRAHLPFGSKHRLYGKRLTSTWLPTPTPTPVPSPVMVVPQVVVTGPGTGGISGCSRLSSASMSRMCRYQSERERQMSQIMDRTTLRIPAPALAAFAIQRALRG